VCRLRNKIATHCSNKCRGKNENTPTPLVESSHVTDSPITLATPRHHGVAERVILVRLLRGDSLTTRPRWKSVACHFLRTFRTRSSANAERSHDDVIGALSPTAAIPRGGSCRIREKERKGKEEYVSIYIAPFCAKVHTKRSGMDHTVLPANNTMPAFPSYRSPDVTTAATEAPDIQLQLTTHLSTPKG